MSDYMKLVPDQIAPWVPGGLMTLGHRRLRPQRHATGVAAVLRDGCGVHRASPRCMRLREEGKIDSRRRSARAIQDWASIREKAVSPIDCVLTLRQ